MKEKSAFPVWGWYTVCILLCLGLCWGGIYYGYQKRESEYASLLKKAQVLSEKQIYDEALRTYKQCEKIHPDEEDPKRGILTVYVKTEDYEKAIAQCEELLKDHPKEENLCLIRSACFEKQNQWKSSYLALKPVLRDSEKAQARARMLRGKYELEYQMLTKVTPWVNGEYSIGYKESSAGIYTTRGKESFSGPFTALGPGPDLYPAQSDGEWFYVDSAGKRRKVPTGSYTFLSAFHGGCAAVRREETYGYLTKAMKPTHMEYEKAYPFEGGYAFVRKHGLFEVIDSSFGVVKTCSFDGLRENEFGEAIQYGVGIMMTEGKQQMISPAGTVLNGFQADEIRFPEEKNGWMAFRSGKKWGFVSPDGQIRIEPAFEEARSFSKGYAAVRLNGKWGYIDESGVLLIPCTFEDAYPVSPQGTAWVSNHAGYQLLTLSIYKEE